MFRRAGRGFAALLRVAGGRRSAERSGHRQPDLRSTAVASTICARQTCF